MPKEIEISGIHHIEEPRFGRRHTSFNTHLRRNSNECPRFVPTEPMLPFYEHSEQRRERLIETEAFIKNCVGLDPCTEEIQGATFFNELFQH
jgi:hypothetical protein